MVFSTFCGRSDATSDLSRRSKKGRRICEEGHKHNTTPQWPREVLGGGEGVEGGSGTQKFV